MQQDPNSTLANWMNIYSSALAPLTIPELSIPGTHDSGTYDMPITVAKSLSKTQSLSLYEQLIAGARALDLRVGYQSDKTGDERYVLVHGTWKSNTSLTEALQQVKLFIDKHPKEIVILDFHRFTDLERSEEDPSMPGEIQKLILDQIGGLLIPPKFTYKSLEDIWRETNGRIVAASKGVGLNMQNFWEGVDQKWADTNDKEKLRESIEGYFKSLSHNSPLWSVCAVLTPQVGIGLVSDFFGGVSSTAPEINNWFHVGGWTAQSNIISVDWLEETEIPAACAGTSIIKGIKKSSQSR